MTGLTEIAASYALVSLLGLAAGATITHLVFRVLRVELRRTAPSSRIAILLALLVAPPFMALLLALSVSAPWSTVGIDSWAHCASHADLHGPLCGWHPPQLRLPAWLAGTILLIALFGMLPAVRGACRLAAGLSRLSMLRRMGERSDHGHYILLPIPQPLAFAAGFVRVRIFVSDGLKRALSDAQMRIVLAHEQAHVRRCDMAMTMLVDALSRLQWPEVGESIRSEWRLAIEQRCDEIVAAATGDRASVADCLVRVARLQRKRPTPEAPMAFRLLDSDLATRVNALLAPPANRRPGILMGFALLQLPVAALPLLSGTHLHRWAEMLLPAAG